MEWINDHPPYVKGALRSRPGPLGSGPGDGPGLCDGLEAAGGEMGVVTAAIADFASLLPEIDLETGCEVLRQLAEAVRNGFARHFPGCRALRFQETGVASQACVFAQGPSCRDPGAVLGHFAAFRAALAGPLSERFTRLTGCPLVVEVGYARLDAAAGAGPRQQIGRAHV